jgi:DHA1 family bicyclomycin/chloramphenicol resistance-like MFS transporter
MQKNIPVKSFRVILVMGLLTAIGPLSIDMYLPAFPAIAKNLHSTVAEVTLSLSSFFIGISAGQLLYGPLLERFGRKKPLYFGLSLYLLASVGCALATSVEFLIVTRLFQAVGGCAGLVAARAMVRDLFAAKENAKIFSTLMLVVAISPIVAPTLGGYITAIFGWRYVFAALILIVMLILAGTYFYLPESREPNPAFSLKPAPIIRNFISIIKHPHFNTYALTGAVSYAGLYGYVGGSPYVFIGIYKVSESTFGWIFALIAMGLIGASQANNFALKKYSSEQIIKMASVCQVFAGLTLATLTWFGWIDLYLTVALIFAFLSCQGFIFPNTTALALAPMAHNAGNASALVGAIQMSIGAAASAVVGIFHDLTAFPMVGVMTSCSIVAFCIFSFGRKMMVRRAAKKELDESNVDMISTL